MLLEEPYRRIAGVTEQSAREPRLVVVIDVEVLQEEGVVPPRLGPGAVPPDLGADRTSPSLPLQHLRELLYR